MTLPVLCIHRPVMTTALTLAIVLVGVVMAAGTLLMLDASVLS